MDMPIRLKTYEVFNSLLSGLAQDICLYIGPKRKRENGFCLSKIEFKIPDSREGHLGDEEHDMECVFYCESNGVTDLKEKWQANDVTIAPLKKILDKLIEELGARVCNYKVYAEMLNDEAWAKNYILYDLIFCDKTMERYMEEIFKDRRLPSVLSVSQLSAQQYEGQAISGRVLFVQNANILKQFKQNYILSLKGIDPKQREWDIRNQRYIRKMMEVVTEDSCLIVVKDDNGWKVHAVMQLCPDFGVEKQATLVEFVGYLQWRISYDNTCWGGYRNGIYELGQVDSRLCEIRLNEIAQSNNDKMLEIVKLLQKEKHGTAAVFMEKNLAKSEAERLARYNRCIALTSHENTCDLLDRLKGITRIDGAMIIDLDGNCHAIGAILDGELQITGKTSRGARYNSLNNYVHVMKKRTSSKPIFCAIISEDKTVDILDGSE